MRNYGRTPAALTTASKIDMLLVPPIGPYNYCRRAMLSQSIILGKTACDGALAAPVLTLSARPILSATKKLL